MTRNPAPPRAATAAKLDVLRTPACSANTPAHLAQGLEVSCGTAVNSCPPEQILINTWTSPAGQNQWSITDTSCLSSNDLAPGTTGTPLPTVTMDDVRRLGLPAATSWIQPASGQVLLNLPVDVYATAAPVVRTTTLLGYDVTVRATPIAYRWSFGDGTTLGPTPDPGAAYPDLRHTHTYTRPGRYTLTLTTTYTATYTVAGQPARPVTGTAQVTSPARVLTARAGTTVLTD